MKRILAALVLGVSLSACSGSSSPTSSTPAVTPTKIMNVSGNLQFGNVVVGQTEIGTLTITNSGNATLTVNAITVVGTTQMPTGYSASWSSGTIVAGGTQTVLITFAPTATAYYAGVLTVVSDQTGGNNAINISGTGVPATGILRVSVDGATCPASVGAVNVFLNGTFIGTVPGPGGFATGTENVGTYALTAKSVNGRWTWGPFTITIGTNGWNELLYCTSAQLPQTAHGEPAHDQPAHKEPAPHGEPLRGR